MSISKDDVISRLELRYDFQSARNIFGAWVKASGEEKGALSKDDIKALVSFIEQSSKHADKAISGLHKLAGIESSSPAAPAAEAAPPAAAPEPPPAAAAPAAEEKAPEKEAEKAPEKEAEKAPEKKQASKKSKKSKKG